MNALDPTLASKLVPALAATLAHSVWQGFAIAAMLAGALFFLRNGKPQVRYVLGCLALTAMVCCFAGTVALGSAFPPAASPPQPREPQTAPRPAVTELPSSNGDAIPVDRHSHALSLPAPSRLLAVLPNLCVALWLGGMGVLSLRAFEGWRRVLQIQRRADPAVPETLLASLRELSQRLGVASAVAVLLSEEVQVPSVLGWPRAVLLVPAGLVLSMPPRQLEAILAHELAHVRRWDFPVNLLQTLIETVLFYHPAVWWISEQIRVERENCCDDLAVECLEDRLLYARALTALEELRARPLTPALGAADGPLLRRVRRIVGQAPARVAVRWSPAHAVTSVLLAALLITLHGRAEAVPWSKPSRLPGLQETHAAVPNRKPELPSKPRLARVVRKSSAAPRHPARKLAARSSPPAAASRRPVSRPTPAAAAPVPATPVSAVPRSFSGLVTEAATGRPLPQIEVAVLDRKGGLLAEAVTDGEGRYRLPALRAAAEIVVLGRIRTTQQRYRTEYSAPVPARRNAFPLAFMIMPERLVWDLPWTVDPAWTIIPTAVITGRLVDEQTGAPVPGRDLIAYRGYRGAEHARTDAEGRFSFRVLPGANRIAVMRDTVWVEHNGVRVKGLNASSIFNNLKVSAGQRLEVLFEVNPDHFKSADWELKEAEFLRRRLDEKEGRKEPPPGEDPL